LGGVKVDIYSDVVCPWCYLAKRRFETALAGFPGCADVQIEWKPFQLDPGAPGEAHPVPATLATKFGGEEQARQAIARVTEVAAADGLTYDLAGAHSVNTFNAHRLVWWARERGGADVQAALAERLFAAHLSEAADLGDPAVLAGLAAEVGLDGAGDFLASGGGVAEVKESIGEARALGIDAVPTFVFDERWAVSGAQSVEVFGELLGRVADASVSATQDTGGCCGGGCCA
jgi:predicted DsbA family dithiol-disulfide isomerase